jgi:GTP diphosphokinase / guanosine-3',5'-bis(diphosphate) 3'-diphosphatase
MKTINLNMSLLSYLNISDIIFVQKAYEFAEKVHRGITRKDGSQYITHPIAVVEKLAAAYLDKYTLAAALLHDVIEDTETSKEEIQHLFGKKVAELVQGVTKLDKLENLHLEDLKAKNIEKIILAMTKDARVIIIKLADRLHNMETLCSMKKNKQYRIARETQDIYVQLAGKLGMYYFKRPLENLSFQYLYPYRYQILGKKINLNSSLNMEKKESLQKNLLMELKDNHVKAEVLINRKNISRIYKAMKETGLSFDDITSGFSYSIVVDNIKDCYEVLGLVHQKYRPLPGRFKDYIASPKANGYQSLHTKVITQEGSFVEIQILTENMQKKASHGVICCLLNQPNQPSEIDYKTKQWFKSLINLQEESLSSSEFIEQFKLEIKQSKNHILTPKSDLYELLEGSTVIDFAYAIHTDIGNHAISALVNHKRVALSHCLENGDVVQIITNQSSSPKPVWLDWVATSKAKIQIKKSIRLVNNEKLNSRTVEIL